MPPSAWQTHLTKFRSTHPQLSLKECMQGASRTYQKAVSNGKPAAAPPKRKVAAAPKRKVAAAPKRKATTYRSAEATDFFKSTKLSDANIEQYATNLIASMPKMLTDNIAVTDFHTENDDLVHVTIHKVIKRDRVFYIHDQFWNFIMRFQSKKGVFDATIKDGFDHFYVDPQTEEVKNNIKGALQQVLKPPSPVSTETPQTTKKPRGWLRKT